MKTNLKQFVAAIVVAIFTAVCIFGLNSKSDAKICKNYKPFYEQALDSSDEDGNGGPQIPPDPNK